MARWTARAAVLCFIVVLAVCTQATAGGFVLYHKTFGDWSVTCWREMAGTKKSCTLSAPQPSLAYRTPPNIVQVHEYQPDAFQIVILIRDRPDTELPASLRVDRFEFRTARIERGYARWFGQEAVELLVQMRAGKRLAYRVQTAPDGLPRDMNVSLAGFSQALAAYRQVIRSHGLLSPKG
jgi:invasion protein IalB